MATLFEKRAEIVRTAAMGDAQARALSSSIRRLIVKILYRKSMTISEIAAAAAPEGIDRVQMTIRHHVEILRQAGIIEVVKIVPVRGTVEKYYTATTRLLVYSAQEDFDEVYSRDIRATARKLDKVVDQLARKTARRAPGDGADPEYEQFLLAEIINRAMTLVLEARNAVGTAAGAPASKPATRPPHRRGGKARTGAPL